MSSSPRPARIVPESQTPVRPSRPPEVLPFPYGETLTVGQRSVATVASSGGPSQNAPPPAAADFEREAQLHGIGRQQGILESRSKFEEQLVAERAMIARALADFFRERTTYYRKIEEEAVQLALAIARKVIHREAQVDPLLLMGIVRVAVERIEGATEVALRLHPSQASEWRKYLASSLDPGAMPQIVEDPAIPPRQCVLRTSMGSAELGLEVQLKEIEKGLMDLLAARPGEKP